MSAKVKNITDLRGVLTNTIAKLYNGKIPARTANSISVASNATMSTLRMQMLYNKLLSRTRKIPFLDK